MKFLHSLHTESRFTRASEKALDMGLARIGLAPFSPYLTRKIIESRAKILHSHFGNIAWKNSSAAKLGRAAHVVTFYGYDVNMLPKQDPVWKSRYRNLFRDASLILCEGPHMASCIENLGCPKHKIRLHHLGVELEKIPYQPRQYRPDEGPLKILIAGTFTEKKGIPYALRALGRLQKEVDLELTLIGDAPGDALSTKEKEKILSTIAKEQLASRTRRLGFVDQQTLWKEAYNHHLFLSPSVTSNTGDTEGGAPVVLIEMAASGMPLVSTEHCDIPEVIVDGKTGWLAEERNVDDLVRLLRHLVVNLDWRPMLDRGRRHIETNYSAVRQGQALAEMYRGVFLRSRRGFLS